jgi:hypothetical protein
MPACERAAVAIRLAAAIEVEALPLAGADPKAIKARSAFLNYMRARADQLLSCEGSALQERLADIAHDLICYRFDDSTVGSTALKGARDRVVSRLREECAPCAKLSHCCCQLADGPSEPKPPAGGPCISEIRELMRNVENEVRRIYAHFAQLPVPRLQFSARGAHAEEAHGLFQEFHLNGWTDVESNVAACIVGLDFKEGHFDWPTLCQTLYVFVHEMMCHAFQGLHGERRNSDERCSWSEGWMDALAWTLTERWIEQECKALPAWLRADTTQVGDACASLHNRRYRFPQPGTLDPAYMHRRRHARSAFHKLRKAMGASSGRAPLWRHRAAEFSLRLNLCGLDPAARDTILNLLTIGLLDTNGRRFESVVGDCSEFCEHHDPQRLAMALRESIYGIVH